MKAMILAAGRGERLRPLTDRTPKPMLHVHGRPLLEHQIDWLKAAGIRDLVINLHHLGGQIEAHFGSGAGHGVHIRYSREAELLDTGGGIVKALPLLGTDPFVVMNGDIFTDFPLADLAPLPDWAAAHLLLTPRPAFRESGDFDFDAGRIPRRGNGYVYCGIAILRPRLLDGCTATAFSLRERFFEAVEQGRASGQVWTGAWTDIGNREQLDALNAD